VLAHIVGRAVWREREREREREADRRMGQEKEEEKEETSKHEGLLTRQYYTPPSRGMLRIPENLLHFLAQFCA